MGFYETLQNYLIILVKLSHIKQTACHTWCR